MVEVINENGEVGENGLKCITFGVLFILYQDISDTLVGILMRAKKYKKLHVRLFVALLLGCIVCAHGGLLFSNLFFCYPKTQYKGQMLFQGMHNDVVIQLLK